MVAPHWLATLELDKAPSWVCMRDGKVEHAHSPEDTAHQDRHESHVADKRKRHASPNKSIKRRSSQDSVEAIA